MRLKKVIAMTLIATMAASLVMGCSKKATTDTITTDKGNSPTATVTTAAQKDAPSENKEVIELRINIGEEEDPFTDPVAQALTKATGVKLKIEYGLSSDDQRIPLMIANQDYPDLLYTQSDATSLVDAGALIDMTDLIEQYGPNIKKMYGEEFYKLKYSKDDPAIYMLSSYGMGSIPYTTDGTMQMQWDVLKENNYEYPRSLDAYEKILKSYIKAHPKTEDGLDTIGLSMVASDWRWYITFGNPAGYFTGVAGDNGQWFVEDDKDYKATYRFCRKEEKEYFRWLNRMYNEGILDSEFATQTYEDYIAKLSTGRVLSIMDCLWDYSDAVKVLTGDGKLGKTYACLPLTANESYKCSSLRYNGLITGQGIGISSTCKDPVAAIKFLDYVCSDEGQVLLNWGIEGVNYLIDEKGHRYRTPEEINASNSDKDYEKKTGVKRHTFPFPAYGSGVVDSTGSTYTTASKEAVIAEYNEEQKAACKAWNVELLVDIFPQPSEFAVPKYAPSWAYAKPAEFTEIEDKLNEIAWSGLISSVMAKEAEFDAVYDEMLTKINTDEMQKAGNMLSEIIREKAAASQ